jgi:hypothetical protein
MISEAPPPYKVELLAKARTNIKRCAEEAIRLGIAKEYAATLGAIHRNLSTAPLTWGDPLQRLPSGKVIVFQRLYERVLTIYAVREEAHLVYVKDCQPVLGHPLE